MPRMAFPRWLLPSLTAVLLMAVGAATVVHVLRSRTSPGTSDDRSAEARWRPDEPSDRWQCIVIHHSGGASGGATQFDDWHRTKGWDELGYHFVIGNGTDTADGQVEIGSRWPQQKHGAHCHTKDDFYNQHGIGICLVGNFDKAPPSARQMRSLTRLVAFLAREFNIAPEMILTHGGITGETKCPGKLFDLDALRKAVAPARQAGTEAAAPG